MQSTVPRRGSTEYSAPEGQCIEGSCAGPEILVALRGQGSPDRLDETEEQVCPERPVGAAERTSGPEKVWPREASLAQKSQHRQGGWIGLRGQLNLEQNLARRG